MSHFEGSAAWRLEADRLGDVLDGNTLETIVLPSETKRSLEVIAEGGIETLSGSELDEAMGILDTFLRYPIDGPLACRTAFENR